GAPPEARMDPPRPAGPAARGARGRTARRAESGTSPPWPGSRGAGAPARPRPADRARSSGSSPPAPGRSSARSRLPAPPGRRGAGVRLPSPPSRSCRASSPFDRLEHAFDHLVDLEIRGVEHDRVHRLAERRQLAAHILLVPPLDFLPHRVKTRGHPPLAELRVPPAG